MLCKSCNKEIPDDVEFCIYCGKKVNGGDTLYAKEVSAKSNKNRIGIKTKILIGIIIIILLTVTFVLVHTKIKMNGNMITNSEVNNEYSQNEIINVYEKNKIGFLKDEKVLEEKYNNNGDLIYCKYKFGDEIKEDYYEYEYDSQGRTIGLKLKNDYESYLKIEYANDKIIKVISNYEIAQYVYNFYYNDNVVSIDSYSIANQTIGNQTAGDINIGNSILVTTKEINGKKYKHIGVISTGGKGALIEEYIYEASEESDNILKKLGIIPTYYGGTLSYDNEYYYSNIITEYIGFGDVLSGLCLEVKRPIYAIGDGMDITRYEYDEVGRKLMNVIESSNENLMKIYYKYENIDENSYWRYYLMDTPYHIDTNQRYVIGKEKIFLENNNICKIELYKENYISEEEYELKRKEFMEYIEKSKIDTEKIISEMRNTVIEEDFDEQYIYEEEEGLQESINQNMNSEQDVIEDSNVTEEVEEKPSNNMNEEQDIIYEDMYAENENNELDDTVEITDIVLTSEQNVSSYYYTLQFRVKLKIGKDAKGGDKLDFYATINGEKEAFNSHIVGGEDSYIPYSDIIYLNQGENKFIIEVANKAGESFTKTFTVIYDPPALEIKTRFSHGELIIEAFNPDTCMEETEGVIVTANGNNAKQSGNEFVYTIKENENQFNIVVKGKTGKISEKTVNYE